MKRIKMMAVAVPAAAGIALPLAAPAAASAQAVRSHGKTVSVFQGTVRPDTGCATSHEFHVTTNGNVSGHGWAGNYASPFFTCIGTVVESLFFTKGTATNPFCKYANLSIKTFGPASITKFTGHRKLCGEAGTTQHTSWGIHQSYGKAPASSIAVTMSSTYSHGGVALVP